MSAPISVPIKTGLTATTPSHYRVLCDQCPFGYRNSSNIKSDSVESDGVHATEEDIKDWRFVSRLYLTDFLMTAERDLSQGTGNKTAKNFKVPLHQIQSVFRRDLTELELTFKTLDVWRLRFLDGDFDCHAAYVKLNQLLAALENKAAYAFQFKQEFDLGFEADDGWKLYAMGNIIERMDIPTDKWRVSDINNNFQLSDSMPEKIIVPARIDDKVLREVAGFRQLNRLPYLAYHHKFTKAVICRSGQPLMGPKQKRSIEDEQYMQEVLFNGTTTNTSTPQTKVLPCIIEARTKTNALSAKAKGGGYEADGNYLRIRMFFTTIESPSFIRDAFVKFTEAMKNENVSASSFINSTSDWLKLVQSCLRPATFLAKAIAVEGASCLVHCDDGLDNTAILVSIGKILIDPYYRTIEGLMALVEEEWVQAGFRFAERCNQLTSSSVSGSNYTLASPNLPSGRYSLSDMIASTSIGTAVASAIENTVQQNPTLSSALSLGSANRSNSGAVNSINSDSPIFILFLDCVYQIFDQFPKEFEYSPKCLQFIFEQTTSCQFGTFLFNSPKERAHAITSEKTVSVWTFLKMFREYFVNPLYDPTFTEITPECMPLPITSHSKRLTFLSGFYDPFDSRSPLCRWHRLKWTDLELSHALEGFSFEERTARFLMQRKAELSVGLETSLKKLDFFRLAYLKRQEEEQDRLKQKEDQRKKWVCPDCGPLCLCGASPS